MIQIALTVTSVILIQLSKIQVQKTIQYIQTFLKQKDFVKVSDVLKEAAYQLKARKISDFPIFPIAKVTLPVRQTLISKEQKKTDWNYNFSFLDEFVQCGFVDPEKMEDFKSSFKNPDEFCCLFVVEPDFMNFLFVPYPED